MALREELSKSGSWLFRWRSYLPLLVLALIIFEMRNFSYLGGRNDYDRLWNGFCIAVSLVGLAIRMFTIGHAARGTSGRNTERQEANELNTTGMYSIVRNPLYVGNFFMTLGIALFPHSWGLTIIIVLLFVLYYERIVYAEEEFLRATYGEPYLEWANRTPACLPDLRKWKRPNLVFSTRFVLRREYSGILSMVAVFTLLEVIGDSVVHDRLVIETCWGMFFLTTVGFYLTMRFLKRHTRVLSVPGR